MTKVKKIILAAASVTAIIGVVVFSSVTATNKEIVLNESNVHTQYSNVKLSLINKIKSVNELVVEVKENFDKDSEEYKTVMAYRKDLLDYTNDSEGNLSLRRDLTKEQAVELYKKLKSLDLNNYPDLKEKLTNDFVVKFNELNDKMKESIDEYNSLIETHEDTKESFLGGLISKIKGSVSFDKINLEK